MKDFYFSQKLKTSIINSKKKLPFISAYIKNKEFTECVEVGKKPSLEYDDNVFVCSGYEEEIKYKNIK